MGRKPVPRQTYRGDGITVHRILTAIELDELSDPRWKAKIVPLLRDSVSLLLSDEHKSAETTHVQPMIPAKRKAG